MSDQHQAITTRCADTAAWLATVRVSQDGWAEVLERVTRDLSDLAAAMESGKIISHISDYRSGYCKISRISDILRSHQHNGETHDRSPNNPNQASNRRM